MAISNNAINNTVGASINGVTNTLTIQNPSNSTNSQANALITVGGTTAGNVWTQYTIGTTQSYSMGINNASGQILQINGNAGSTVSPGSDTLLWEMNKAGVITTPLNPAFMAHLVGDVPNATGNASAYYIQFNAVDYDQASNFTTVVGMTGIGSFFTAPVDGVYQLNASVGMSNINVGTTNYQVQAGIAFNPTGSGNFFSFEKYLLSNFSAETNGTPPAPSLSYEMVLSGSVTIFMPAGSSAGVWAQGNSSPSGTNNITISAESGALPQYHTFFSGCKVA